MDRKTKNTVHINIYGCGVCISFRYIYMRVNYLYDEVRKRQIRPTFQEPQSVGVLVITLQIVSRCED